MPSTPTPARAARGYARKALAVAALSSAAATAVLVAGCMVGPNYKAPDVALPASFDTGPQLLPTTLPTTPPTVAATTTQPTAAHSRAVAAATQAATRKAPAPVDVQHWWTALDDPELNALVDRAVEANFDVGIATARLQEARALYAVTTQRQLPELGASVGAARGSGTNNVKSRVSSPLNAGINNGANGFREVDYAGGFDSTWELDLFGGLRRAAEAAAANAQAAAAQRNQVLVTVIADVARAYVNVRSAQLRLKITQDNIAALRRTVDLTRIAFRRGIGNELDVVLAERQLSAALSRVAPIDAEIKQGERQIAILLGRNPQDFYAELDKPAAIPAMVADVDPGLPVDLVRRRPDVNRAERQLAAATAHIGVATADLFPAVAVTGGVGIQGQGLGISPPGSAIDWSVGPAVRLPILDFGRLDALVQVQDYRTQQVLLSYRKTVLSAVAEVEDALTNYAAERNRLDQLTVAVASSQQAVNLATQRYNRGLTDFLNVLDAQRQLYSLEDQLATSQQAVSRQLIALFKALGGGWESFGTVPMPPSPRPAMVAAVAGSNVDPNPAGASAHK